ncbi:MAG: zinc-binding alcohol dehydrogenase [Spirochaetota bacterium]
MKSKKVVFAAPWKVEVQDEEFDAKNLPAETAALKRIYSLISAGTELACLSGGESWFKLPGVHGYTAISEVTAVGSDVKKFSVGDKVYHFGKHCLYSIASQNDIVIKIPDGIEEKYVPFTRMATIAMTALRTSEIELGDYAAVTGLGLVGNFAMQLARLQGANVIAIDPSKRRRELASACGARHTIDPLSENSKERVLAMTDTNGVNTFIEASGVPKVFIDNIGLVGKQGEAILLGSPRGDCIANVTDLLNMSHLWGNGCVTIKGAHEWRYPVANDQFVKHSIERNSRIVMDLIASKKLMVEPLHTHTVTPDTAAKAYEGLRNEKDTYIGVVIDWR